MLIKPFARCLSGLWQVFQHALISLSNIYGASVHKVHKVFNGPFIKMFYQARRHRAFVDENVTSSISPVMSELLSRMALSSSSLFSYDTKASLARVFSRVTRMALLPKSFLEWHERILSQICLLIWHESLPSKRFRFIINRDSKMGNESRVRDAPALPLFVS